MSVSPVLEQTLAQRQSGVKLTPMTAEYAISSWDFLAPFIERAMDFSAGRLTIEGAKRSVEDGHSLVLIAWRPEQHEVLAVLLCEGNHYLSKKVFSIGVCGGANVFEWAPIVWPGILHIARDLGYEQVEVKGRRGWGRFLEGASEIGTFYAIDLKPKES